MNVHALTEVWFQVILAGKKETVSLALRKAESFRTELLRRGVLLVPVIWGEGREPKVEKKGFGLQPKAAEALPSIGVRLDITMSCALMNPALLSKTFCFFDEMKVTI